MLRPYGPLREPEYNDIVTANRYNCPTRLKDDRQFQVLAIDKVAVFQ